MSNKILIFDSHPVQYRVPIWKIINEKNPGILHVIYASDCSVRGHADDGFGRTFAWDEPMLEGYDFTILNCEKGKPLAGWGSLTGKGVKKLIKQINPRVIILTGINYRYDLTVYFYALIYGIPLWLRCETQDDATPKRSFIKSVVRSIIYKLIYKGFSKFYYIGELNKQHYLQHGVPEIKVIPALYGTVDRTFGWSEEEKTKKRLQTRASAGINNSELVIGFAGKFIPKKNPEILFVMLSYIPDSLRERIHLYFVGSGELESNLIKMAALAFEQYGIKSFFSGFINQSEIATQYLAMDILVLPSKRMGETWGLVVNEAMQAGCGVVVSSAVGSGANFGQWDKFRVFDDGNAAQLAEKVMELSGFERDFNWAIEMLQPYNLSATADTFVEEFLKID